MCSYACWLYTQPSRPRDSILAVGTSEGEVFLLSCVECRVIYVFSCNRPLLRSFIAGSDAPITSVTVSSAFPNLLLAVSSTGALYVWDVESKKLLFESSSLSVVMRRSKDLEVRSVVCEAPIALLLLRRKMVKCLQLTDFSTVFATPSFPGVSDYSSPVVPLLNEERLCGVVSVPEASQWVFVFSTRFVTVNQLTGAMEEHALQISLAEYVDDKRISLTRDHVASLGRPDF